MPRDEQAVEHIKAAGIMQLFDEDDIYAAIEQCNFSKGLGPDGFDGQLLKDPAIAEQVVPFLLECCNEGKFP